MITIYSTKTCAFCVAAKQYLNSKKIDYDEVLVDQIENGANILIEKSGQLGVPVIDVGGEIIVGFNRESLDKALNSQDIS